MDLAEVQQLSKKFTPEIVRRITWAIINDGRAFFNTILTQQDFNGRGVIVFPQSFLAGVLENIRFCNPIQRGNFPAEWLGQPRTERNTASRGAPSGAGGARSSPGGDGGNNGGTTGGGTRQHAEPGRRGKATKRAYEGFGSGSQQGAGPSGGGGGRRWAPPSPDPCHPKIAALMNPYLAKTNGCLFLPTLLDAGNITIKDLPALEKIRNERTGRSLMCWAHVLGPCHYGDYYFGSRGGHPEQSDYNDQFTDPVVQVLKPAVSARMQAMSRVAGEKRAKAEPGATA